MSLLIVPNTGTSVPKMSTLTRKTLSAALFAKSPRAVLGIFYEHPDQAYYLREIVDMASKPFPKLNPNSAARSTQRFI